MPNYRTGNEEYRRRPKMYYERDYEPETDVDDEDVVEAPKEIKDPKAICQKPCFCTIECPFKVIVKVVPVDDCCDDHKRA